MMEIKILSKKILSGKKYLLSEIEYRYTDVKGEEKVATREVYDRKNGAVVLLYNPEKKTVVLTRQFRMPSFLNGNKSGMLIEACAGVLDEDDPELCARREAEEETGYRISEVKKVFEVYMSPGGITEILYFFTGIYSENSKISEGGGLEAENEEIDVLEMPFEKAYAMIGTGEIRDAKTIMLLQHAVISKLFG